MGPMLMFDKSALELLSEDEAVWLEFFFLNNITPMFYVEVLADLEKAPKPGKTVRTPEQIVSELATKVPVNGTFPNVYHSDLVIGNLLGRTIEMNKRAVINGGQPKVTPDGKISFFYDELPEQETLNRWQDGKFLEVEREKAKKWRTALSNVSFEGKIGLVKNILPVNKNIKSLTDIKDFVDEFVKGNYKELVDFALEILDIPSELRYPILDRWEKENRPAFNNLAPYASYVLTVDLFFYLALMLNLISDKPSNKIDFAYLYYLPFCRVFVSNDTKTHAKVAPLFMTGGQLFILGEDLKKGLHELDEYYSLWPDEVKAKGVMAFAHYPPRDKDLFITRLWDKLSSSWRKDAEAKEANNNYLPDDTELIKKFSELERTAQPFAPTREISSDDADNITFARKVRVQRGKWRILPPGIENADKKSK